MSSKQDVDEWFKQRDLTKFRKFKTGIHVTMKNMVIEVIKPPNLDSVEYWWFTGRIVNITGEPHHDYTVGHISEWNADFCRL